MPPIEFFASGIVGDGVADDSVAIKAAHDAAFAAGVREVMCARQYYAPSAYNLGNVHFRGPGKLIGTYRKRVVSLSAPAADARKCASIDPTRHLTIAARSTTLLYQIIGDSTSAGVGGTGANNAVGTESLWELLQDAIARDNPAYAPVGTNRGIPGSTYSGFYAGTGPGVASTNYPSWDNTPTAPYTAYTKNLGSVCTWCCWGVNGPNGTNGGVLAAVLSTINAQYTTPTDVGWITNLPNSSQVNAGGAGALIQDQTDQSAAFTRAYARWQGQALIDNHRMACMVRDGFDPCDQVFTTQTALQGTTQPFPYVLPYCDGDFDVTWTIDNTGGGVFGTAAPGTSTFDMLMSADTSNLIRFQKGANGQLTALFYASSGVLYTSPANPTGLISSGITIPAAVLTFRVSCSQDWIQLWFNGTMVFEGTFFRGSARYQPTIKYTGTAGATSAITIVNLLLGQAKSVVPSLTDFEMYGSQVLINPGGYDNQYSLPSGGNGSVHPASGAFKAIHKPILDNTNFSVAASGIRPTQTLSAAGTISSIAGVVVLAGPASGSYAVALNAPTARDAGRLLSIEMPTAPGGSVTLALTNVTGGTGASTCTWMTAKSRLVLEAGASAWEVIKQDGVVLT